MKHFIKQHIFAFGFFGLFIISLAGITVTQMHAQQRMLKPAEVARLERDISQSLNTFSITFNEAQFNTWYNQVLAKINTLKDSNPPLAGVYSLNLERKRIEWYRAHRPAPTPTPEPEPIVPTPVPVPARIPLPRILIEAPKKRTALIKNEIEYILGPLSEIRDIANERREMAIKKELDNSYEDLVQLLKELAQEEKRAQDGIARIEKQLDQVSKKEQPTQQDIDKIFKDYAEYGTPAENKINTAINSLNKAMASIKNTINVLLPKLEQAARQKVQNTITKIDQEHSKEVTELKTEQQKLIDATKKSIDTMLKLINQLIESNDLPAAQQELNNLQSFKKYIIDANPDLKNALGDYVDNQIKVLQAKLKPFKPEEPISKPAPAPALPAIKKVLNAAEIITKSTLEENKVVIQNVQEIIPSLKREEAVLIQEEIQNINQQTNKLEQLQNTIKELEKKIEEVSKKPAPEEEEVEDIYNSGGIVIKDLGETTDAISESHGKIAQRMQPAAPAVQKRIEDIQKRKAEMNVALNEYLQPEIIDAIQIANKTISDLITSNDLDEAQKYYEYFIQDIYELSKILPDPKDPARRKRLNEMLLDFYTDYINFATSNKRENKELMEKANQQIARIKEKIEKEKEEEKPTEKSAENLITLINEIKEDIKQLPEDLSGASQDKENFNKKADSLIPKIQQVKTDETKQVLQKAGSSDALQVLSNLPTVTEIERLKALVRDYSGDEEQEKEYANLLQEIKKEAPSKEKPVDVGPIIPVDKSKEFLKVALNNAEQLINQIINEEQQKLYSIEDRLITIEDKNRLIQRQEELEKIKKNVNSISRGSLQQELLSKEPHMSIYISKPFTKKLDDIIKTSFAYNKEALLKKISELETKINNKISEREKSQEKERKSFVDSLDGHFEAFQRILNETAQYIKPEEIQKNALVRPIENLRTKIAEIQSRLKEFINKMPEENTAQALYAKKFEQATLLTDYLSLLNTLIAQRSAILDMMNQLVNQVKNIDVREQKDVGQKLDLAEKKFQELEKYLGYWTDLIKYWPNAQIPKQAMNQMIGLIKAYKEQQKEKALKSVYPELEERYIQSQIETMNNLSDNPDVKKALDAFEVSNKQKSFIIPSFPRFEEHNQKIIDEFNALLLKKRNELDAVKQEQEKKEIQKKIQDLAAEAQEISDTLEKQNINDFRKFQDPKDIEKMSTALINEQSNALETIKRELEDLKKSIPDAEVQQTINSKIKDVNTAFDNATISFRAKINQLIKRRQEKKEEEPESKSPAAAQLESKYDQHFDNASRALHEIDTLEDLNNFREVIKKMQGLLNNDLNQLPAALDPERTRLSQKYLKEIQEINSKVADKENEIKSKKPLATLVPSIVNRINTFKNGLQQLPTITPKVAADMNSHLNSIIADIAKIPNATDRNNLMTIVNDIKNEIKRKTK